MTGLVWRLSAVTSQQVQQMLHIFWTQLDVQPCWSKRTRLLANMAAGGFAALQWSHLKGFYFYSENMKANISSINTTVYSNTGPFHSYSPSQFDVKHIINEHFSPC